MANAAISNAAPKLMLKGALIALGLTVVAYGGYRGVRFLKDRKRIALKEPQPQKKFVTATADKASFNFKALNKGAETILVNPTCIDEAAEIGCHVRNGRMCVVDLTSVPSSVAQRIADYLCGNCDAFDGTITRINNSIFTVATSKHRNPREENHH